MVSLKLIPIDLYHFYTPFSSRWTVPLRGPFLWYPSLLLVSGWGGALSVGSLGQGLSVACGMAYAGKHFDKVSSKIYGTIEIMLKFRKFKQNYYNNKFVCLKLSFSILSLGFPRFN